MRTMQLNKRYVCISLVVFIVLYYFIFKKPTHAHYPLFESTSYERKEQPQSINRNMYTNQPIGWEKIIRENVPCYRNGIKEPSSFIAGDRCWQRIVNGQQKINPDTASCMFQPLTGRDYKRHDKKTVVLSIGVHIGHALSENTVAPCANIEVINWERRMSLPMKELAGLLIGSYSNERLQTVQKTFWDKTRNDPDLNRADIITCGFDAWHCLIFAPFNKKMIINNAYRFEGHIQTNKENAIIQQNIFYNALRYNPDVILAGEIVYDVMYAQHFLGTHKLVPLLGTPDYVVGKLFKELKAGKCSDVPSSTVGYHPTTPVKISISPKRLSAGGKVVAKEMKEYFQKRPLPNNYKVDIMETDMKQPYNYCDLGKYTAHIVLGYSVMSFFTSECVSLGIPMFAPSPKLYAEWERDHHLIQERKNNLNQISYDDMTENPRSLNKGFNPNDDFNVTAIEHWVKYSDYFYFKGVVTFDSLEDLYVKIAKANFSKLHEKQLQHTVENALRTRANWESIDRYFHGYEDDVISSATPDRAETMEKGLELWNQMQTRTNFNGAEGKASTENIWVLINLSDYRNDFSDFPDCTRLSKYTFLFYETSGENKIDEKSGCHIVSVENINKTMPDIFKAKQPKWRSQYSLLVAAIHATQNGATKIINLVKGNSRITCKVDPNIKYIIHDSSSWKQQVFESEQLWLAFIPAPIEISSLYTETLQKFTSQKLSLECSDPVSISSSFSKEEIEILKDYLENWVTDERDNFYSMVDQLNFEIAVKGYLRKSDAILHRLWMQYLATLKFNNVPLLTT